MNIRQLLNDKVHHAMQNAGIPSEFGPHLAPSKKPGFGDYQANGAMAAAKAMKTNPRELAEKIVAELDLKELAQKIDIAGPGFINIHLAPQWLAKTLQQARSDERLLIATASEPQTIVADYSSPNLAKEMHVGHLRSTIIGDAVVRLLEYLGHRVIRQNHVGDWGTQFGMLLAELETKLADGEQADFALSDLETFYRESKSHFDNDPAFADKAREYVVKLQGGDADILALWQKFKNVSLSHAEEIYTLLNTTLTEANVAGESEYNADLPILLKELQQQGLAVEDQGAQVVFLPEMTNKEGQPAGVIIQKQGGGYLYATTDLAAIRHRVNQLHVNRIMIFTDARQALHFKQIALVAAKAGFLPDTVSYEHHTNGTMMGEDGKPFKTRSGDVVKLKDLIIEAIERATDLVASKNPELTAEETREIGRKVGVGAIKYADLSKTRTNDYIFNWDSMLSFEGNTAPYLQYAYTRVQSIFRKANITPAELSGDIHLNQPQEQALAVRLLQFNEALEQVAKDAYPHVLCNYLYELASLYMTFYEHCPILKQDVDEKTRNSRLQLCQLVSETLRTGLDLLGVEVMEKM